MITFSKIHRSNQPEIMDDFELDGSEMKTLLTDLKTVNKLLGGNTISINGVAKLITSIDTSKPITIVDIGCGDGEMLRQCANFGLKNKHNLVLIGIDANPNILKEAEARSKSFKNITYKTVDVFSTENKLPICDIALCTLFLHHFNNESIITLLNRILEVSKVGVVINDLQRSKWAFNLFKVFSYIFIKTKIARHDGLVSVARGFTKNELVRLADKIVASDHLIRWKWAFRYQWIINK